ncbi:MAG: branched-chain amino acid ABC transporter permease, partial [Geminicoccaceae bacterium]
MTPRPIGIAVFALLALAPLLGGAYAIAQLTLYVIYGTLAMSLALIWGRAGLLCFGQAMFFGIGAYAMAISTKGMAGDALASTYVGLLLAIGAAGLFAALLGYFLFWGRGLSGPYLAIVTLAIALILERLLNNWYALGGYNGLLDVPPLSFTSLGVGEDYWEPQPQFYLVLAVTAVLYLGLEALLRAPFGIVLSAIKT